MKPDAEKPTPLEPDDPRISEWIDGRLSPVEAAAIERAVRESPALATLVADLRAIKEAARLVASAATPAGGFTDRVMARIAKQATADAETDPAVDAEWEAIEAERIAAERAEAAADLAEAAREPQRHWPWLALLGALAAGLLMTVVLNLPRDGGREVALAPAPESRTSPPPAGLVESEESAADRLAATAEVAALDAELAPALRSLGAASPALAMPAAPAAAEASEQERGDADVAAVTVRGPAGRAAFERQAAALGLAVAAADSDALFGSAGGLQGEFAARRAGQPLSDVIVISGSADAIERLLAETDSRPQAAAKSGIADRQRAAAVARVVVRLIELPEPGAEP